jgi:glycosyltransferase involved in cell wall biosynthesis
MEKREKSDSAVAVVIPVYNNMQALELVLTGLCSQTYCNFQVWVVSDGGTPEAGHIVSQFKEFLNINYCYMGPRTSERRVSAARNLGAEQAIHSDKPDRLLFIDGDCVPSPAVVGAHAGHGDSSVAVCGVRWRIAQEVSKNLSIKDVPSLAEFCRSKDDRFRQEPEWRKKRLVAVKKMAAGSGGKFPKLCHSFQISYPARNFTRVGGFCTKLAFRHDQDLAQRFVRAGGTTFLDTTAVCYHFDHPPGDPVLLAEATKIYTERWGPDIEEWGVND